MSLMDTADVGTHGETVQENQLLVLDQNVWISVWQIKPEWRENADICLRSQEYE